MCTQIRTIDSVFPHWHAPAHRELAQLAPALRQRPGSQS
eukprot:SAG22_NODE_14919_length_361_cov_1.248092_1_plen_38_part_10